MPVPATLRAKLDQDSQARRSEYVLDAPAPLNKRICCLLRDSRDLPVATLLLNIVLIAVPAALIVVQARNHWLGALFFAFNYVTFLQRYLVALLHVSEHRPIFRKGRAPILKHLYVRIPRD